MNSQLPPSNPKHGYKHLMIVIRVTIVTLSPTVPSLVSHTSYRRNMYSIIYFSNKSQTGPT